MSRIEQAPGRDRARLPLAFSDLDEVARDAITRELVAAGWADLSEQGKAWMSGAEELLARAAERTRDHS